MSDEDLELLNELVLESTEHMNNIEPILLNMEQSLSCSPDEINDIFRAVHSIKGGFGFFGKVIITKLTHSMENVFDKLRANKIELSKDLIDVTLTCMDKLRILLDNIEDSDNVIVDEEVALLQPFIDGTYTPSNDTPKSENAIEPAPEEAKVEKIAEPEIKAEAIPAPKVVAPKEVAPVADTPDKPTAAASSGGADKESLRVKVSLLNHLMNHAGELVLNRNQLLQILNKKASEIIDFNAVYTEINKIVEQCKASSNPIEINKVASKIDSLKQLIANTTSHPISDSPGIAAITQNLDRVTTNLQEQIMNTRMQTVGGLFNKFPRIVRDLSKQLDKEITIQLNGQDVELDKSIIEKLSDPLVHLVRNSVDHGIEDPKDRTAKGKDAEGTITLNAYHEGGKVNISIIDDGGGIDQGKVLQKALEKNIVNVEEAENLTEGEVNQLIFAPGFSTASEISAVSGRGVGMDVVKTNIESLGGSIQIESQEGKGTQIYMRLPLTLAIIPALIASASGRQFAIPQVALEELVRIRSSEITEKIKNVNNAEVLFLRGDLLPLVRLSDALNAKAFFDDSSGEHHEDRRHRLSDRRHDGELISLGTENENSEDTKHDPDRRTENKDRRNSVKNAINILVLKVGEHRYGLIVDEVHDNEEIVIKPLSKYVKKVKCYSGSAILGNGSVAMIIDTGGLSELANMSFSDIDIESNKLKAESEAKNLVEKQELLLFNTGGKERYAMNLDLVARVEKISVDQIEKVGDDEFIYFNDKSLKTIRLDNHLPVSPLVIPENNECYVIIPKLVKHPMGIICSKLDDTLRTHVSLEKDNINAPGILGSAKIKDVMTLIVDIYTLFEKIDPEHYERDVEESATLEGKKILFAEDTDFFRQVISKFLTSHGAIITVACDGQEAWEILQKGQVFDVVVTDIQMPRMDGFQLTQKIRASSIHKDLPIMALTSMANQSYIDRGKEVGINAYEIKLDKERQRQRLEELVSGKG